MFRLSAIPAFLRVPLRILQTVTYWFSSFAIDFLRNRRLDHASSQKTLSSLPPEILSGILYYLDARSLLSAKLTCRTLYDVTRSRQFWHHLFQSLESPSDGPNFHEKLHRHTVQDLEHWAIKRLRAYDCWVLDEPLVFQPRSFLYSEAISIEKAQLLPGGRYLIANNFEGQFFVCDLDLPRPQLQLLFDPGEYDAKDKTLDNLMSFEVWVDLSAEFLSFRVAVWRYMGPAKRGYVTRTRIYQVNLSKEGEELRWTATRIFGKRSRHYARRPCVGLSDSFLVEARATGTKGDENLRQQLVLHQYMPDADNQLMGHEISAQIGVENDVCGVFVSSDGHVMTIGPTFIDIYTISELEHHNPQREVSPVYRFSQGSYSRDVAPPFFYRGYTWMVILHRDEYHLLRLSEDMTSNPPLLIPLGRHVLDPDNGWFPGFVGQTAAAAPQLDWSLNIITYSWNVEAVECAFRIKRTQLPRLLYKASRYTTVGVDMTSGRVVLLLHSEENTCTIFDTA